MLPSAEQYDSPLEVQSSRSCVHHMGQQRTRAVSPVPAPAHRQRSSSGRLLLATSTHSSSGESGGGGARGGGDDGGSDGGAAQLPS